MPRPDPSSTTNRDDRPDEVLRDDIRDDSDALLDALGELRRLESAKRDVPMSTPEFHDKARRIEDLARRIFGLARRERVDGDRLTDTQTESITDEAAEDSGTRPTD